MLLLFGAALLFGDGTITPAISVLSAMEGLESVNPKLVPLVIPGTVGILAVLFSIQRFGTGRLGFVFGWVIVEYVGHRMARWQRSLFGFLSRNVSYAPDYFFIPHTQIIEFTWMLRA